MRIEATIKTDIFSVIVSRVIDWFLSTKNNRKSTLFLNLMKMMAVIMEKWLI